MRIFIHFIIRILIFLGILLPLLVPYIKEKASVGTLETVKIVISDDRSSLEEKSKLLQKVGLKSRDVEWVNAGSADSLLFFERVLEIISKTKVKTLLAFPLRIWGEESFSFKNSLKESAVYKDGNLFLFPHEKTEKSSSFVILNRLFLPNTAFLEEETSLGIELTGSLPEGDYEWEAVVRSSGELLSTFSLSFEVEKGKEYFFKTFQKPIRFIDPGTHIISVEIQGKNITHPYSWGNKAIKVVHPDTTLLHIAYSPDWAIRRFRQKLKFWPGVTLLSFYILRDYSSKNNVPTQEMSLVEFPSDKLFGEQLKSFHGVIIQNFPMEEFLTIEQIKNILEYVKDGGRLLFLAGPRSFDANLPYVNTLFPCQSLGEFVTGERHFWKKDEDKSLLLPEDIESSLENITSRSFYEKCIKKEDVISIAQTAEGSPIVLAQKVGKGLVMSVLSGDWMLDSLFSHSDKNEEKMKYKLQNSINAVGNMEEWFIRFLQRRDDVALRAPYFLGPRIVNGMKFIPVEVRGAFKEGESVTLSVDDGTSWIGKLSFLPMLGYKGIMLNQPLNLAEVGISDPSLVKVHETSGIDSLSKVSFPVWEEPKAFYSNLSFYDEIPIWGKEQGKLNSDHKKITLFKEISLLEAYPWLLGFILFLLFLDVLVFKLRKS